MVRVLVTVGVWVGVRVLVSVVVIVGVVVIDGVNVVVGVIVYVSEGAAVKVFVAVSVGTKVAVSVGVSVCARRIPTGATNRTKLKNKIAFNSRKTDPRIPNFIDKIVLWVFNTIPSKLLFQVYILSLQTQ
jgi:hypothetical protein